MADYTKLIDMMRKAGSSDEDVVSALQNLGLKRKDAELLIGKAPKPRRQIPPEIPKTVAKTPTQEAEGPPEIEPEPREVKVPGRFRRAMKALGDDSHEAVARAIERRYGLVGQRVANNIRRRRGLEEVSKKKDSKGVGDKDLTREIDKATQTIVGSIAHLGGTLEKVLSKVDYGVRNSTDRIVKELDRITDRLKQQEYRDTEEEAEAGSTEASGGGAGGAQPGAGSGLGAALLAGGAAGLLGMGLGSGEAKAAGGDAAQVKREGEDKQVDAKQDTSNQDIEWKAEKITFQADEALFSRAFDRILAGGGVGSLSPAQAGALVGSMAGGGEDPTGDSGSFRKGGGRAARDRSGRYDYRGPDHVPGKMAKGKRAANQMELYKALKEEGYNDKQAKIITANATGESIDNPANYHWDHSHMSGGIFQWDPSRSEAIRKKFGKYPWEMSIKEQAGAFKWEVDNNPRFAATKKMLADPNATDAQIMGTMVPNFEAPADAQGQTQVRLGHLSGVNQLVERESKKEQEIAQATAGLKGGQAAGDSGSPAAARKDQERTGPRPLTDQQFEDRMGPQPLSDSQFDGRFGGPPKPLSDAQFINRFNGNGTQIEAMSTQSKAEGERPTVVETGKKKESPKIERTADDAQDDKDSSPPPTSREDHYKDFLGIGVTKTPGLGL